MNFNPRQFKRSGMLHISAPIEEVFPLLCPKKEEDWIPGWACETIWSKSGYNEAGAIFRTEKPYGTELYWTTLKYNIKDKIIDFLITAPRLFMFHFTIEIDTSGEDILAITTTQVFTSVSEQGNAFIANFEQEDYDVRVKHLENLIYAYLDKKNSLEQ